MSNSSASASAADPSLLEGEYDVFLNFCGEDTRYGFTDYLYTSLDGVGICTFRDSESLQFGEEIGSELLKAITDSKISIPIFSKNYASKKWCLLELAHMVQCLKNGGQVVLPIFYDVEPNDVQDQRGSYEDAFRQHKDNGYDEKDIQEWKDALKICGNLKGLELKKETGGHQGKLVNIIKDKVLELLKQNNKHEDLYLVGMPCHIEKMEEFLNIHYGGVRFIGIHGMGGLGKTTIAEVIYDKYQHHFECHSFIRDVREESESRNGIVNLQKKLLLDICKTKINFDDPDEGRRKIKDVVRRKNVLIVLDDVNEDSQIYRLAESWQWFHARARIIITTRNKEVLRALERGPPEVYRSYQPNLLNDDDSLKLFSHHAFMSKSPPEDYDTLSKKVASTAAGLPLVLKVIGSSLYGEADTELWEDKIKELKEVPNEEVQKKLKLSFDPLTSAQKEIFLDIACLFIGHNKINPCYMWDDCGFHPRNVLNVLIRRSLITVGDDDILRMHDQLRDLGRQIVREGKLEEWGRWSRLWDDKAVEVYRTDQGTEKVKALCLKIFGSGIPKKRRMFGMSVVHLEGEKFLRLPHLRWLQWKYQGRLSKSITPTNLHLRNLVILDLSYSYYITEDSDLWNQIQMFKKLKVLDLSWCKHLKRVPFLSTFLNLERLVVKHCYELRSLDGVEELEFLRYLDATRCISLKTPLNLSRLTKLKELKVKGCDLRTDIPGLDKLESLERLPDLSNLKWLKELDASGKILTEIRGLSGLKSLEVLDMSSCIYTERVFGLTNLKRLKRLHIQWCPKLIEIHGLEGLESLGCLVMDYCTSIETLPDLSKLKSLKALSVRNCVKLTEIRGLEELKSLEYLDIGHCKSIENLPDVSNLRKLEVINAPGCEKLTEIRGLEYLESFINLVIYRRELPYIQMYSQLSGMRIRMFYNDSDFLDHLKSRWCP